jgi:hypothetical protein
VSDSKKIYWGNALIQQAAAGGESGMVERDGELFYKIANYQAMPPFFVAVVSGTDHWMFVSSNGGLTCGRRNPDNALFPYYTDDKIHDADPTTGSVSFLLVETDGRTCLWKPFSRDATPYALERNLYKNLPGNKLLFEEINHDLGLAFFLGWSSSERYGFVKKSGVQNIGGADCAVEIIDGLRNLLPCGILRQTQTALSTLLDAYKQAEQVSGLTAGVYSLSSILTDRAEPCEALKASVAWSVGLDTSAVLLSEDQLAAFCAGAPVISERHKRGKRGAFLVHSAFTLPPKSEKCWYVVADVNRGPVQLAALFREIRQGVAAEAIEADIEAGTRRLVELVGGSDGCQLTSDALVTARHFSNTLFNIMRGGTFYDEYAVPPGDFIDFVATWNRPLRDRMAALLDTLEGPVTLRTVLHAAGRSGDADLERLALEYLPLTFSRRHGDPSRPWNEFSIDIKNADGSDKLYYQGNWRDIFQNWEALSLSYPEYIESFIAKFVNASTADGYNPYRITKDGIDWEVLEPDNNWSNIGYWGDHQINYLLKLLELSKRYHPGKMADLLTRQTFVYADVPYRIKGYGDLVSDPRNSVVFDYEREAEIARRVEELGSDGRLIGLPDGSIYKVSLLEKLLLPVLAKMGNFVPGGGLWMNTQRPEWNDANNALVGYGLSMVTLCYLRRYLALLADFLDESPGGEFSLSSEVLAFFSAVDGVLQKHNPEGDETNSARGRKVFMDEMGAAGQDYRQRVYSGFSGEKAGLAKPALMAFIKRALAYCDHSIQANRRADGLFHSYNLIHFGDDGYALENLYEMLEGQVAVLSSGKLSPGESLDLLERLRASRIYRPDQNSYMLYPDREQVDFLDRNCIPPELIAANDRIRAELDSGRTDLVEQDIDGRVHFNFRFRNAEELSAALGRRPQITPEDAAAWRDTYETVFRHRQFTGRSGSMYKYEGLGCIYWHMVSKLLLATAEVAHEAEQHDTDRATLDGLKSCFDEIKDGLGMHKAPEQYGAFPIDPYSHTPGFIGVQQPGMTGQVKEDVITRFCELGVVVDGGQIEFAPTILRRDEFLTRPRAWRYSGGAGENGDELEPGCLAFTVCGVPVIYRLAQDAAVEVFHRDGSREKLPGNRLGRRRSESLFQRDGRLVKIVVDVPAGTLR